MELTREQFIEEIKGLKEGTTYNVSSSNTGNVNLYLRGCSITANSEDGVNGEITFFKPHADEDMEVTIDFDIVNEITKQGNTYTLSFNNGLVDADIEVIA